MRLSLLIPTRERADLLASCLRTVCAIRDRDLEIIVSDNASGDETQHVIEAAADPRIRIVNTGRRVSQRQNFEFALSHATGDYVMAIGDDDAVLAAQWPRLRAILAAQKPHALSWPALFYHWPGPGKHGGGGRLRLQRAYLNGNTFERTSAMHRRALCTLERTREDFSPKLYHGMLSRRVIEALRAKTGDVLMSGQVDAYIAAAALSVMPDYLYVRHPFTILAMGPQSGGSSVAAQHRPGDSNESARRVAQEAMDDPVREPLPMPYPVLGFYLLNGLEQARRHAFDGDFPLDYRAYFRMIEAQLGDVGGEARQRGLALLEGLAAGLPNRDDALADVAGKRARLEQNAPPPVARWRKPAIITRLDSLSMIELSRLTLDLKPRGLADVAGAARMADWLIGGSEAVETADPEHRWRCTQLRAVQAIFGRVPD